MSNSPAGLPTDLQEPEIHSELETMRHSCAHIMAHAIQKLWPQAKFGIGPTVEDGFYYDVDLDVKLTPEDLPRIEKEMAAIIKLGKESKTKVVFVQPQFSEKSAAVIAKEIGANIARLDPLSPDWANNLRQAATAIADALK